MNSKYRHCHNILKFLYDDRRSNNQQERLVGSVRIAEDTNIPILKIHELQHILLNNGDIVALDNDGQSMMSIQQQGITSFVDRTYLKDGTREFWDGIFNWARILIPLLALILSLINFFTNNSLSKRISNSENRIKKIENIKH